MKIPHLEHDNIRLCSIPNLPGTPLSLHWVSGLVGSPCHTVQYLIQEFIVTYGMVTPGFTITQSDVKRLALSVVAFDLDGYAKITVVFVKGSRCSYLPSSGTSRRSELGEGTTRTHWGLLK